MINYMLLPLDFSMIQYGIIPRMLPIPTSKKGKETGSGDKYSKQMRIKRKIGRKISLHNSSNEEKNSTSNSKEKSGRWDDDEHERFLEAMKLYGNRWTDVTKHIKTRTADQIRSQIGRAHV